MDRIPISCHGAGSKPLHLMLRKGCRLGKAVSGLTEKRRMVQIVVG